MWKKTLIHNLEKSTLAGKLPLNVVQILCTLKNKERRLYQDWLATMMIPQGVPSVIITTGNETGF